MNAPAFEFRHVEKTFFQTRALADVSFPVYAGQVTALALTPFLVLASSIPTMLMIYGVAAVVAMLVFLLFSRERPPAPPCPPDQEARSLVLDGLNKMIRQRDFIFLMVIFFVGLGAFNAVTTWIEQIEEVDLDDLNPESLWKFRIKGFGPLLVAMDSLAQWSGGLWQLTPSVFVGARAVGRRPAVVQHEGQQRPVAQEVGCELLTHGGSDLLDVVPEVLEQRPGGPDRGDRVRAEREIPQCGHTHPDPQALGIITAREKAKVWEAEDPRLAMLYEADAQRQLAQQMEQRYLQLEQTRDVPGAVRLYSDIPDGITADQALMMTDALATAWFGARNADIQRGSTVAVVGLGPIGLLAAEAVAGAGDFDQLALHAFLLESGLDIAAVLDRHQVVGVARDQQRGGVVGGDLQQGRNAGGVFDGQIQSRKPIVGGQVVRRLPNHDPQIRRRHDGHHGLDAIARSQHGVFRLGIARVRSGPQHQRKVAAGAVAVHAQPLWIDAESLRVGADIAHRTADVFQRFRNPELGTAAVPDREHGETLVGQRLEHALRPLRRLPIRVPAAADHEQHAGPVGFFRGLENVERQGQPELVAVHNVRHDFRALGSPQDGR